MLEATSLCQRNSCRHGRGFRPAAKWSGNNGGLASRPNQTAGFGHAGSRPQHDLSRIPQARPFRHCGPRGKTMTETVAALLVIVSIGIFLAHAFDAYRTR
jgi:hypothetical protein